MPAVDREAMPPAQRAAWDRLWRALLLTPESTETRAGDSLATGTDAGATADTEAPTTRNDSTDRSGRDA
jgi:hypothetical protein